MKNRYRHLEKLAADILVDGLPGGMKDLIRSMIAKGWSKASVLASIRHEVRRQAPPGRGRLTLAACEELIDRMLLERN